MNNISSVELVNFVLPSFFYFCRSNGLRFYMCNILPLPEMKYKLLYYSSEYIDVWDTDCEIIHFKDIPVDQYQVLVDLLSDELKEWKLLMRDGHK